MSASLRNLGRASRLSLFGLLVAAILAAALEVAHATDSSAKSDQSSGVRMMLKVQIPVVGGNAAVRSGTQGEIFEALMEKIKPEAAYFTQEDGLRTAYFVYVIHDTSEFAAIHEPLIQGLGARVYDMPALTWDELSQGFEAIDEKP